MKQHISKKQLYEISMIDMMVFCGWDRKECEKIEDAGGCVYFDGDETTFTIGRMIEFLDKNKWWDDNRIAKFPRSPKHTWAVETFPTHDGKHDAELRDKYPTLVQALWEAVKEILEK